MTSKFDQATYWIDRHKKLEGDPRSVGNLAASVEQNIEGELELNRVVARAAGLLKPAETVLDLGCGYGRVSRCFTGAGYDYLGVDVSPQAVRQARLRNPLAHFEVADLATWQAPHSFDVVAVLYVFVHFVEDAAWRSMLTRALSWVAPGGVLLFADHFPAERENKVAHVLARPLHEYEAVFRASGFRLDDAFRQALIGSGAAHARQFRLAKSEG